MNQADQIAGLEKRIASLEAQLKQVSYSSQIPRAVEAALTARLPFLNASSAGTPVTTPFSSFPVSVQTATKTLAVVYKGVKYNLLCQ